MSDRPELGSLFAFLFSAEQSQTALNEYQAALEDLKEGATAEETIQLDGPRYGVTSMARGIN